jgi:hypothetical protein
LVSEDDPAKDQNLGLIPTDDLKEWLRIERNVLRDFYATPSEGQPAQRAQWARSRCKRIEEEIRRRSQRLPRGDE